MNRREFLKAIGAGAATAGPLGTLANVHNDSPRGVMADEECDDLILEMDPATGAWFVAMPTDDCDTIFDEMDFPAGAGPIRRPCCESAC